MWFLTQTELREVAKNWKKSSSVSPVIPATGCS